MTNDKTAHQITQTQRAISDALFQWGREDYELGTKTHDLLIQYTNKLAHLMAPDLFWNEVWFGRLGHGNKIHACKGSHAMCGTASGRASWGGKTGLMSAHSYQESAKASEVTCEKCRAKVSDLIDREVNRTTDRPTLAELVETRQIWPVEKNVK